MLTEREAAVLNRVDRERVVELAQRLIQVRSENPPGEELKAIELLRDHLTARGLRCEMHGAVPHRPNLIARFGRGRGKTLILNGHLDVVPAGDGWSFPPYDGLRRDGRLLGRGAADMKSGVAAAVEVVDAFRDAGVQPEGELVLALVCDEETGGGAGAGYLVEQGLLKGDMCLVCEPSGLRVVIAEEGMLWLTLRTRGRMVHSIMYDRGINAVERMLTVLQALEPVRQRVRALRGKYFKRGIFTINVLQGGVKVNQVPDECVAQIDVRIPPDAELFPDEVLAEMRRIVEACAAADPDLHVALEHRPPVRQYAVPEDEEIVKILMQAIPDGSGRPARFWGADDDLTHDDSDLYHLWVKGHIPGVFFGPGETEQSHVVDEWVDTQQIADAARIFTLVALRTVGQTDAG